jgi:1,4-alpha-glucan branching enzyme
MFRVRKDDQTEQHPSIAYRTDLYSRCQVGSGRRKPEDRHEGEPPWNGTRQDLGACPQGDSKNRGG